LFDRLHDCTIAGHGGALRRTGQRLPQDHLLAVVEDEAGNENAFGARCRNLAG